MSKLRILTFLSLLILYSCQEEFVCESGVNCPETFAEEDNNLDQDNNDPSEPDVSEIDQNDNQIFVVEEGETYFMGADCGTPTGDYAFPSEDEALAAIETPEDLPIEYDLSEFLPPIGNQGIQPSCVSWAVTYYMKTMQEKIQYRFVSDLTNTMSPAYTYNQLSKGYCTGTSIVSTLEILKTKGALSLSEFPYIEKECHKLPTEEQDELAKSAQISDYKSLSGENIVNEMKTLLTQETPVMISAVLDTEFGTKDFFDISAYREHNVVYEGAGCHAMLVVGYSDFYNAFKVVNSWGRDWGDNGFVWIDYKAFENITKPDDPFRVITGAYVAYDAID